MSKRKMTVEYLRAMVKKSFADVDIDEVCKMCVLPFQSLVDTVNLYEDKLACQEVEIQRLTEENKELYKENTTLIAGSILERKDIAKDTAKEILQELYDQIDGNTPKWVGVQIKIIAKRKGVEVE